MQIAQLTLHRLASPVHALARWCAAAPVSRRRARACHDNATNPIAQSERPSFASAGFDAYPRAGRPLRVLRVIEPGEAPSLGRRMVISGRLDDVCAELDRLAALEAAACSPRR